MDNNNGFNQETEFENDFSPLNENVVQRDYTRPNVQGQVDATPIEEATIIPPSFEDLNQSFQQNLNGQDQEYSQNTDERKVWGQDEDGFGSANPYQENLDKKDQKKASTAAAEAILDGYAQLKAFSNRFIQFPTSKIQKLINEGLIDKDLLIPVQGQMIPLMDYIEEYNKQCSGIITVTDEFRDKVLPVLVRVLQKRNIGLTDEQLLAYYFGMDIIQSAITIYNLRGTITQSIEEMKVLSATIQSNPQSRNQYTKQEENVKEEPQEAPKREYVEPEEYKEEPKVEYADIEVVEEPKPKKASTKVKMPEFGNESILQQMEDIANGGKGNRRKRK